MTAERLFAEQGIAAVSLRAIASAAGQKNNAAVHYYFGDRENLVREIVSYRVGLGEADRANLMAQLVDGRVVRVYDLMSVFVYSLAGYLEEGDHFLAFLARYAIERGGFAGLEWTPARFPLSATLQAILRPLVPECPERELEERWIVMMTSALHTLARYQAAIHTGTLSAPLPELLDELVLFLTGGMTASATDLRSENRARSL